MRDGRSVRLCGDDAAHGEAISLCLGLFRQSCIKHSRKEGFRHTYFSEDSVKVSKLLTIRFTSS